MTRLFLCLLVLLLNIQPANAKDTINFGVISTESTQNLKKQWEPFFADMQSKLGITIKPFFAPDYAGVIEGMRFGKVDVAWYGNKSAIEAVDRAGGEVFAQMIDVSEYPGYHSVLIVHKDSPIESLDDILNAPGQYTFGNGDPNSTSGFLIPSYYVFALNNIDPKTHFKRVTNSSHEFNALAVANKQLDIATNNTSNVGDPDRGLQEGRLWNSYPAKAKELRIVWKSPLIPSEPLVYRKDLSERIKQKLRNFLYNYGRTDLQEKEILASIGKGFSRIKPSTNDQLIPLRLVELHRDLLQADEAEKPSIQEKIDVLEARAKELGRKTMPTGQ